jgi:hypothetical protein
MMSAKFLALSGQDTRSILVPVANGLSASIPGVPGFVLFLAGGVVALAALVLWLELVVREAAITAAALFLPLVLAALVWPSISHWARRLADTLAALVLSKLVIAAVISLAVGALTGASTGSEPSTRFGDIIVGIALLLLATLSPFAVLRLIPAFEAGAAAHLEGQRKRMTSSAQQGIGAAIDLPKRLASGAAAALPVVGEVASVAKRAMSAMSKAAGSASGAGGSSNGSATTTGPDMTGWPTDEEVQAMVESGAINIAPKGKTWTAWKAEGSTERSESSSDAPEPEAKGTEGG